MSTSLSRSYTSLDTRTSTNTCNSVVVKKFGVIHWVLVYWQ